MKKNREIKLMAHLVAGFPSFEDSYTIARALRDGGAHYLEVQFPFSDPSADGKPIQAACSTALSGGIRVKDGFRLVEKIRSTSDIPVFIMSYGNLLYTMGVKRFAARAAEAGAEGIIAPDLMPGSDEGLYRIGRESGVAVVPVITPHVSKQRLELILAEQPRYMYCALRSGITGDATRVGPENISFLEKIRQSGSVVMAGFGIQSSRQIDDLAPHADVAIAGSVFVREIREIIQRGPEKLSDELYHGIRKKTAGLLGIPAL